MGKGSLAVEKEYRGMIQRFGTEFSILTKVPQEELDRAAHPRVAEGIARVRAGRVKVEPGYDGEYGKVSIFGDEGPVRKSEEQISLF
jgi:PHP family Zn ribbon phosphoesterase